jgi:hypothetical protein
MLTLKWTDEAWSQAIRFLDAGLDWDRFMEKTTKDLAEYAQEYFKPMLNVRTSPQGNGQTRDSIKYNIIRSGNEFTIEYTGLLSAYYMDVGNFPPGAVLDAQGFDMHFFPVDKRFGAAKPARYIHGMGSQTPGAPTHWSSKTAIHMAEDGAALEIALQHFSQFLHEVVISK